MNIADCFAPVTCTIEAGAVRDKEKRVPPFTSKIGLLDILNHVAVKLTDDLYISKAGMYADFLLISNLETMRTLW